MDKLFLNKYRRLVNEYTSLDSRLANEADAATDPNAAADPTMGADPNAGAMPADPNAAADPTMGADPNAAGAMPADPNAAADPTMGADPNAAGAAQGAPGFQPQEDPNATATDAQQGNQEQPLEGMPEDDEKDKEQEKALKKTEESLKKLTGKFDELLGKIDNVISQIDNSNERIELMKSEMEKRNPTPEEKLTLRSRTTSYPFSQTPNEYWSDKERTSNYSTEDDKNGEDMPEYEIKQSDIDGIKDWTKISKSFDDERMGLKDILGY